VVDLFFLNNSIDVTGIQVVESVLSFYITFNVPRFAETGEVFLETLTKRPPQRD